MRSPPYGSDDDYNDFPLEDDDNLVNYPQHPQPPPPRTLAPLSSSSPPPQPPIPHARPALLSSTPQRVPSFQCQLDSLAPLVDLLSSLQLERHGSWSSLHGSAPSISTAPTTLLHVAVLPQGLKLTVGRSKVLCANAYLKSALFSDWRMQHDEYRFSVSLPRLLHVLSVFSSSARLVLSFEQDDDRLRMEMEQDGSVCDCELSCVVGTTDDAADEQQLQFAESAVVVRGSVPSSVLLAAFSELELSGSHHFSLIVQPNAPRLRLAVVTEGIAVLASLVPSPSCPAEALTDWQYSPSTSSLRYSYPVYLIPPSLTVLALADHTNLRINQAGMLSMQHVISTPAQGVSNWIEFVCAALDDAVDDGSQEQRWGGRLFNEEIQVE